MLHKGHARDHLWQQCSQTQRLHTSSCKHLKIPLVKPVSQPHQWLVLLDKYCRYFINSALPRLSIFHFCPRPVASSVWYHVTQLLKLSSPPVYFVKNKVNHAKTTLRLQANSLMSFQSQGWSWSLIWNDGLNLSTFVSDLLDRGMYFMIRQIITRLRVNFHRAFRSM